MEDTALISVVVPVYNVEDYLSRCVDSILAQTYRNLEIFLVDDGAKDSSGTICDSYAARDSRVRVIHKENGGLSSARNAGIDAARGTYITFVDSDDYIAPDTYETMIALARQYNVSLVCAGRYDVSSRTGEKKIGLCPVKEEIVSGTEVARRIFLWDNLDSSVCDKLFERRLFDTFRFPLGVTSEDIPVTYRIALLAGKAAMCPKPLYYYFHRPNSITTSSVTEKTFHFSRHTEAIVSYVEANYPELTDAARYFRMRSLAYNVQMLDVAGAEAIRTFAGEYATSRRLLSKQLPFVLKSSLFTPREKLENVLLALGVYRGLRALYHLVKK